MQDRRGIPVAVVPRSSSWKMGIWIWETGLDGSSEGKDHGCERAAYNLSVATSKFGNQQQNDQQLNVKVFNTIAMFGISLILLYQNT